MNTTMEPLIPSSSTSRIRRKPERTYISPSPNEVHGPTKLISFRTAVLTSTTTSASKTISTTDSRRPSPKRNPASMTMSTPTTSSPSTLSRSNSYTRSSNTTPNSTTTSTHTSTTKSFETSPSTKPPLPLYHPLGPLALSLPPLDPTTAFGAGVRFNTKVTDILEKEYARHNGISTSTMALER
ncbi:hypothetical protein K435DRAFT_280652 [Dendrothele bispora CBS 962.96]|uniref:Uncharacterized protein n=1 Tax=Dendrothele bispora (strain CBS 962.96) TaxID=1314807 RepID=A0A4S8MLY7_DENBC|nr:hypothetical protein K435DRAFT_280652 [Dendrothele bispora CBS 962.96]